MKEEAGKQQKSPCTKVYFGIMCDYLSSALLSWNLKGGSKRCIRRNFYGFFVVLWQWSKVYFILKQSMNEWYGIIITAILWIHVWCGGNDMRVLFWWFDESCTQPNHIVDDDGITVTILSLQILTTLYVGNRIGMSWLPKHCPQWAEEEKRSVKLGGKEWWWWSSSSWKPKKNDMA